MILPRRTTRVWDKIPWLSYQTAFQIIIIITAAKYGIVIIIMLPYPLFRLLEFHSRHKDVHRDSFCRNIDL